MEYKQLEEAIRADAASIAGEGRAWTAAEVSGMLQKIAGELARIRLENQGGIDASMGKRSGFNKIEI